EHPQSGGHPILALRVLSEADEDVTVLVGPAVTRGIHFLLRTGLADGTPCRPLPVLDGRLVLVGGVELALADQLRRPQQALDTRSLHPLVDPVEVDPRDPGITLAGLFPVRAIPLPGSPSSRLVLVPLLASRENDDQ